MAAAADRTYGEVVFMRARDHSPVYRITGAASGFEADLRGRQRRYLISMGIRTVCFLLLVVTSGWLRWAFAAGALLLPYVAVVLANSGPRIEADLPLVAPGSARPALGSAPPIGPAEPPRRT